MKEHVENPSRRRLFRGKIAASTPALRLPWIKSEQHFTDHCNQCGDCISACETQIITRDEAGFVKVDFSVDECTFCGKCQQACQLPLFIDKATIEAEQIPPWPAQLSISNKCFTENNIYCQSCQDVCDSRAISFSFKQGSIAQPSVNLTECNQCGACISTCPQQAIALTPINLSEVRYA